MKIHYISCHAILEYDEVKLLTELGHEVHANGAYRDPRGSYTLPRPGIPEMPFNQDFFDLTARYPKTELPPELIEPYDVIIIMHSPEVLFSNWERIKHKRVIWRTIGQSTSATEMMISRMRKEGLEIVRYSHRERYIDGYMGADAVIYFYKDPEEFKDWTGHDPRPINFSQSLLGRRNFCHYDEIFSVISSFPGGKVYGVGNDDLGTYNGGEKPYELLKGLMRDCRVYIYGGTWPASYTLSFMEALMTGIPIVSISKKLAQPNIFEQFDFFEIPDMIVNGVNGYVCDSIPEMIERTKYLLENYEKAKEMSFLGRESAIRYFGKEAIKEQWKSFIEKTK